MSEPILSLTHMEESNDFDFLGRIFEQKEGVAPISEYQHIISQLLNDLEHPPSTQDPYKLSSYLTPAAQISLDILKKNEDSYLIKIDHCLQKMGVPKRFYEPFNKPVNILYKMGLKRTQGFDRYNLDNTI